MRVVRSGAGGRRLRAAIKIRRDLKTILDADRLDFLRPVGRAICGFLGRGRSKDLVQALRWYREAAKGGDDGAQYIVASMYEHGDGTEIDLRLARYWYEMAARNGDRAAEGKVREMDLRQAVQPS